MHNFEEILNGKYVIVNRLSAVLKAQSSKNVIQYNIFFEIWKYVSKALEKAAVYLTETWSESVPNQT